MPSDPIASPLLKATDVQLYRLKRALNVFQKNEDTALTSGSFLNQCAWRGTLNKALARTNPDGSITIGSGSPELLIDFKLNPKDKTVLINYAELPKQPGNLPAGVDKCSYAVSRDMTNSLRSQPKKAQKLFDDAIHKLTNYPNANQ